MNELATKDNVELLVVSQENIRSVEEIANNYDNIKNRIKSNVESIANNFVCIGRNLVIALKSEIYKAGGYNTIYEFADNEFKLKATAVKNLMRIAEKFCNLKYENWCELKEEYKKYSYSQLVELSALNENEIDNNFNPDMTVLEIRENKYRVKLKEYFKNTLSNEKNKMLEDILNKIFEFDFRKGYKASISGKPKDVISDSSIEKVFNIDIKNRTDHKIKMQFVYKLDSKDEMIKIYDESSKWNYKTLDIGEIKIDEKYLFEKVSKIVNEKIKEIEKDTNQKEDKEKINKYLNKKVSYEQAKKVCKYDDNLKEIKEVMDIFNIDENRECLMMKSEYSHIDLYIDDSIMLKNDYGTFSVIVQDKEYVLRYRDLLKYVLKEFNSVNAIFDMIMDVLGPDQERLDLISKVKSEDDEEEDYTEVLEADVVEDEEEMSDDDE